MSMFALQAKKFQENSYDPMKMSRNNNAVCFEDVIASPTFKFLVGENQKPMYLHNSLVARQSKTLNTMMNGNMSEAQDGYATLDDVDAKVFAYFSEWLYTGKYESTKMDSKIDTTEVLTLFPVDTPLNEDEESYDPPYLSNWRSSKRSQGPRGQRFYAADASKQQSLWATFSGGSTAEMPLKVSQVDRAGNADYSDCYLLHAQMYCFADKYDIPGLRQLAIDKLKQNLIDFVKLTPQRIAALIELVAFTSENTLSPVSDQPDGLRDLVIQYTAITFEILFDSQDFQDLLATNGEFFLEVVTRLLKRLD